MYDTYILIAMIILFVIGTVLSINELIVQYKRHRTLKKLEMLVKKYKKGFIKD